MAEKKDYKQELVETTKKILTPGKGILAADESTGTIGKKFAPLNIENTEANRQRYREMLFTTEGLENYISGVIFFDETGKQSTKSGQSFISLLQSKGIVPGIKVDKGISVIPTTEGETATLGLDDLAARCAEYYKMGFRFAKWRAVLKIGEGFPSALAIQENAWGLARYASICQDNGLVPIVEPEILADGNHSIETSQKVTEDVLSVVYKALKEQNVYLEGTLLKPNMVTSGTSSGKKASAQEIGWRTVRALSRTVPPAMPGVVFLSGGQSEEEASLNLNAMNQVSDIPRPWTLTFSYGRALQHSAITAWKNDDGNHALAQKTLSDRAQAHSQAQLGKYEGSKTGAGNESLFIPDYKY